MHLNSLRGWVVERYLTAFHIFALLKHSRSAKITYLNLIILSKQYVLRLDIVVYDIFLFMQVIYSLGNLQPILPHLLHWHLLGNQTSKIAISAVLEYKIKVYFIRKCILEFDYVSIL